MRLLIRVVNSHFYDIKVNGRRFFVSFHFFKSIRPKELTIQNLFEYISNLHKKFGIYVILLYDDMMLAKKLFLYGIYHALMDQFKYNARASPIFALNVLMHAYCTRQVNTIKERLIPQSFNEVLDRDSPLAMILVGEDVVKGNFPALIDEIENDIYIEPLDIQDEDTLRAGEKLSKIFDSLRLLNAKNEISTVDRFNIDWLSTVLRSKMALYSLNLQLKI